MIDCTSIPISTPQPFVSLFCSLLWTVAASCWTVEPSTSDTENPEENPLGVPDTKTRVA